MTAGAVRVGLGFDIHPFAGEPGARALVLGGVDIPDGPALHGHSDADVVIHAVCDALLGAAGLPDLGTLFPATDDRWRDVSSLVLLTDVVDRVRAAGYTVGNVDVVVAAERPRLAPHVDAMRATLTAACGGPVGVRPKHAEGVGAIGRGEGVAAWAVALLVAPGA